MRSYDEFTRALFAQNQFAIKYDLDAMRQAQQLLGLGKPAPKVVLVAGTNGKGTTCAWLNALALSAGLRVGLYTSPHLIDFRERVRIDGVPLSEETTVRLGEPLFEKFSGRSGESACDRPLSYFELTTLLAFTAFHEAQVDIAIIEVGLGGRLDATNTIDADVSILTSVSLDHQAYLGDTLLEIAAEKVAIARPPSPLLVHRAAGGFDAIEAAARAAGVTLDVRDVGHDAAAWNRALAEAAFERVAPGVLTDEIRQRASTGMRWPGRRQALVRGEHTLLLDGAHNPSAAAQCVAWALERTGGERIPVAIGVSGGRDPIALAEILEPVASRFIAVTADSAPCTPSDQVTAALRIVGYDVTDGGSIRSASKQLAELPLALVTGSLYVVGDALKAAGLDADDLRVFVQAT